MLSHVEGLVADEQLRRSVAPPHQPSVRFSQGLAVVSHLWPTQVAPLVPPPDDVGRELELLRFLLVIHAGNHSEKKEKKREKKKEKKH